MRRITVTLVVLALMGQALAAARPGGGDPLRPRQWGLDSIKVDEAWKHSRGAGALIAIVDDGINLRHPDLRTNVVRDGGFDFTSDRRRGHSESADESHGTSVAGVAAAVGDNGLGISGVAPRATLLPVKVCSAEAGCPPALMARGIRYAAKRNADVINISLQAPLSDFDTAKVQEAVAFAEAEGSLVIAAAGNSSEPVCVEPASSALCVGALDPGDERTGYSNWDVLMSDDYLMAPGGAESQVCSMLILTTATGDRSFCKEGRGYAYSNGTSLAAPFVTGVAALLAAQGLDNVEIRACLFETADDLGPEGRDPLYGYGKVNAGRAVTCAS